MAGKGFPATPKRVNRRHAKPLDFDYIDAAPPTARPRLAATYEIENEHGEMVTMRYVEATRLWWRTLTSSQMAKRWTPTDIARLKMLARLVDRYNRNPTSATLAEIRRNESLLGSTMADRQHLRVRVMEPTLTPSGPDVDDRVTVMSRYRRAVEGGGAA